MIDCIIACSMVKYMPEMQCNVPNIAIAQSDRGEGMHAFFETNQESVVAVMTEGMHFPMHLHSHLEMYLLLSGRAEVFVSSQIREMKPGEMAIIFPNQIHSYNALTEDTKAALILCDLRYTGGYGQTLLSHEPENAFVPSEWVHRDVRYAIDALIAEKNEDSGAFAPLIQLMLVRLLPRLSLKKERKAERQETTFEIVRYIARHFREPMTLDSLANAVGISRYHASHIFSERIGESFTHFLNHFRLSYACSRLRDTQLSVTEIALDAGFESQRTFFRAFKEGLGMTPLNYRKGLHKQDENAIPYWSMEYEERIALSDHG